MHSLRRDITALVLAASAAAAPALAGDVFRGTFTVDGQVRQAGTSNAEAFADLLKDSGLRSLFATYSSISAADVDASLRGVPARLTYNQGSPVLRLVIPSAGVDQSFNGATRDESQDLALKWLQGGGGGALTRVLQQAVATTAIDPIAGNPNSLMSQMGASDFASALGAGGIAAGRFGFGARFGSYSADGYDSRAYNLPLETSFDVAEGRTLLVDAPLTLTSTEGAQSYAGSIGLGMRLPVSIGLPDALAWTLTPMLRSGAVGSVDLGAVGGIWSASLTSALDWRMAQGTRITLGNMVSRLQTLPISYAGYSASYELTNVMYRNGLVVAQDAGEWFGRPVRATFFAIDTRFTGDEVYVKSYREFGGYFTFGAQAGRGMGAMPLSLGVTMLSGDRGYQGFSINLGSAF
jgi:hypothetical protein